MLWIFIVVRRMILSCAGFLFVCFYGGKAIAECEELQARVETLTSDNRNLRDELQSLSEECNKLKSENDSIKEELTRLYGPEAVAKLEQTNPASVPQSHGSEGNS